MSGLFNGSGYAVRRTSNYLLDAGEKLFGSKDPDEGKKINYAEAREIIAAALKSGAAKMTSQQPFTLSHRSKKPISCKNCGKQFLDRSSDFCSKECLYQKRESKGGIKKTCKRCKSKFVTLTARGMYCSTQCKQSTYTEQNINERKRRLPEFIVCKCCQQKVKPKSPRQKFCCTECNDKYYRDKWNARVSMEKKAQRNAATQSRG